MLEAYGIPGLPTDPAVCRRSHRAGDHRLDDVRAARTAIRSSRIRRCSIRASTTRGSRGRQSFKTGYEYQAINTQIDDFNPKYGRDTYGGQFSRPAGAAASDPATYNLADFMFGARNALFDSSTRSSPTCASGCTSATCRTT